MTYLKDTTNDSEEVQLRLLREMSPAERWRIALRLSDEVIRASKRAISRAHPEWSGRQVGEFFIELHYGRELADAVRSYVNNGGSSAAEHANRQ